MFEQLKAVFYADNLVDYYRKDEFFGRLARAANRGIFRNSEDRNGICMEILKKAQQIYEMLKGHFFVDSSLLKYLFTKKELPSQKELCENFNKDEGYISNRIREFFEKVQNKISSS